MKCKCGNTQDDILDPEGSALLPIDDDNSNLSWFKCLLLLLQSKVIMEVIQVIALLSLIEWITLLITILNRKIDYILRIAFFFYQRTHPIIKGECDSAQDVFPQYGHCSTMIKSSLGCKVMLIQLARVSCC